MHPCSTLSSITCTMLLVLACIQNIMQCEGAATSPGANNGVVVTSSLTVHTMSSTPLTASVLYALLESANSSACYNMHDRVVVFSSFCTRLSRLFGLKL